jgi:hypothetical protein
VTWQTLFSGFQESIDIVAKLGKDTEIKAIIVNTAWYGTESACEILRETRKDIYVIFIEPDLSSQEAAKMRQTADLILKTDLLNTGTAMVYQAQKMGAKTFVHYYYPIFWWRPEIIKRYEQIKQTCAELGILFVDTPLEFDSEGVHFARVQLIQDDVIKKVAEYGRDTAFFSSNVGIDQTLIYAVLEAGAIYPQQPEADPFHALLQALGLISDIDGVFDCYSSFDEAISDIARGLKEKGELGRVSTWPVEDIYMYTAVAAEYAVKWINGEVPKEGVDVAVLKQLMEEYAGAEVHLTPYTDEYPYVKEGTGETYENFLLMRMDYLTYGEEHIKDE